MAENTTRPVLRLSAALSVTDVAGRPAALMLASALSVLVAPPDDAATAIAVALSVSLTLTAWDALRLVDAAITPWTTTAPDVPMLIVPVAEKVVFVRTADTVEVVAVADGTATAGVVPRAVDVWLLTAEQVAEALAAGELSRLAAPESSALDVVSNALTNVAFAALLTLVRSKPTVVRCASALSAAAARAEVTVTRDAAAAVVAGALSAECMVLLVAALIPNGLLGPTPTLGVPIPYAPAP